MRTLQANARGEDVKVWQAFLRQQGLYSGEVDGIFGTKTIAATRAFQLARSLEVDGAAGNRTLGMAMHLGLKLADDDPPISGGPLDGVAFLNDAWEPPAPPASADFLVAHDPRVVTNHRPRELPCPKNPPAPVGWAYWNGKVPPVLVEFAVAVETNADRFPMGAFVQTRRGDQLVAARVEWHDYQGATGEHGCFRGTNLMRPQSVA